MTKLAASPSGVTCTSSSSSGSPGKHVLEYSRSDPGTTCLSDTFHRKWNELPKVGTSLHTRKHSLHFTAPLSDDTRPVLYDPRYNKLLAKFDTFLSFNSQSPPEESLTMASKRLRSFVDFLEAYNTSKKYAHAGDPSASAAAATAAAAASTSSRGEPYENYPSYTEGVTYKDIDDLVQLWFAQSTKFLSQNHSILFSGDVVQWLYDRKSCSSSRRDLLILDEEDECNLSRVSTGSNSTRNYSANPTQDIDILLINDDDTSDHTSWQVAYDEPNLNIANFVLDFSPWASDDLSGSTVITPSDDTDDMKEPFNIPTTDDNKDNNDSNDNTTNNDNDNNNNNDDNNNNNNNNIHSDIKIKNDKSSSFGNNNDDNISEIKQDNKITKEADTTPGSSVASGPSSTKSIPTSTRPPLKSMIPSLHDENLGSDVFGDSKSQPVLGSVFDVMGRDVSLLKEKPKSIKSLVSSITPLLTPESVDNTGQSPPTFKKKKKKSTNKFMKAAAAGTSGIANLLKKRSSSADADANTPSSQDSLSPLVSDRINISIQNRWLEEYYSKILSNFKTISLPPNSGSAVMGSSDKNNQPLDKFAKYENEQIRIKLPFADNSFPCILCPSIWFGLRRSQWKLFLSEALRCVIPGGFLQTIVHDLKISNACQGDEEKLAKEFPTTIEMKTIYDAISLEAVRRGLQVFPLVQLLPIFKEVGFIDVNYTVLSLKRGDLTTDMGMMFEFLSAYHFDHVTKTFLNHPSKIPEGTNPATLPKRFVEEHMGKIDDNAGAMRVIVVTAKKPDSIA